ncbi:uncharacterized protein LY89DRAFT_781883 [Mollisia scopiformis]|uniref:Uncharacterized protein n=1 Tax=Mollisia scopiformis TaxID=149040 RepID=A0A194XDB3_MOLSC|nr:uncharacterized protein LY89DRAFT_781883 [Mollisia scopiformis]KUJ17742.1 hypothetical protein LY89DRAFT_781883 [Mollisia scopiformis]
MENDMQAIPPAPISIRSGSPERGRERLRTRPLSYASSPQLSPSPFSQDQTSSRSTSKHSSLQPPPSSSSASPSPDRKRSTSPYPSPFVSTPSNDFLFPQTDSQEEGLHRQPSTRLEIATAIRQPSFPQFRNSIITKPSMSLITRPGIIHVQPSQPLARTLSPTTPLSAASTIVNPHSPLSTTPESAVLGRNREARVSVINVGRPSSGSGYAAGTRTSARASLLAGPGPAIRPAGPRPMLVHSHTDPSSDRNAGLRPELNSLDDAEERARFLDMKVEQILGPRNDRPRKEERKSTLGLQDVKKMIGDMKESEGKREKKIVKKERDSEAMVGKELWQSMYSMSGETLDEGSGSGSGSVLGMRGLETPDRLMSASDGEYSPGSGTNRRVWNGRRGCGTGMAWWKRCLRR